MKANPIRRQRRGFTLVELLVVIAIIVALASLAAPKILSMRKKSDQVLAVSNGRQIVMSLTDFSNDYGTFPDKDTAKMVTDNTGTKLNLNGDTANDYFRQLIATGKSPSEEIFFAKTNPPGRKPDNSKEPSKSLEAGEVGFCYIMNGTSSLPGDDPNRIIAATPLFAYSTKGEFDAGPLDGKAAMVYLDNSVKLLDIRQDNKKVNLGAGKFLLDTGENTIWGTEIKPVIKPPKKK